MINTLNDILLSNNVVKNFHEVYSNNKAFYFWLNSILPELEKCLKLKQDNPWHVYNCLDHMLHSVEEINYLSLGLSLKHRRMLAYTMFLHDIGKPECLIRRYSKLYKREVDSFFDHNIASKRIAERVLPSFHFSEKDQKLISVLIEEHDMFMFLTLDETDKNPHHHLLTKNLIENKITEMEHKNLNGKTALICLWLVGYSDNKAQNPEMTKNSFELLDKFKDILNNIETKYK